MMKHYGWLSVAALAGGGLLCPVCDAALGATLAAAAAPAAIGVVAAAPADTARVRLAVSGMTCGSCALTARIALGRMQGVYRAEVSYDSSTAVVWYDPARTSPEKVIEGLRSRTGYEARVVDEPARQRGTS